MEDMREIVKRYRAVCDLPVFVRPNAGTPRNGLRYPRTPDTMAAALVPLLEEGIACGLCQLISVATAGAVLVAALIRNDVDEFRC